MSLVIKRYARIQFLHAKLDRIIFSMQILIFIYRRVNPTRTVELVRDNGEKKVSSLERDFGIILGTRVYVKELRAPIAGINVGDVLTHINGINLDSTNNIKEVGKSRRHFLKASNFVIFVDFLINFRSDVWWRMLGLENYCSVCIKDFHSLLIMNMV